MATLKDELVRCSGKNVMIGVRSSFFFVGPSEEALSDLPLVGIMAKLCVQMSTDRPITSDMIARASCDIGSRKVTKSCIRDPEGTSDEMIIIIEGNEFGAFWTRDEYLRCRRALVSAIGNVK